jgi:hypothetical protein
MVAAANQHNHSSGSKQEFAHIAQHDVVAQQAQKDLAAAAASAVAKVLAGQHSRQTKGCYGQPSC